MKSSNTSFKFQPINKVCREFEISRRSIYNWHNSGKLTLKKLFGKTFVDVDELFGNLRDLEREELKDCIENELEEAYKEEGGLL